MSDLLEKRTIQERLIIAKTLLETVLDDLPSELSNNSPKLDNENGELISRQAAIDAFWKLEAELRPSAIDAVLDMLKNLPSAQPRRGKWIKISPANIYECSECGKNVMTDDISAYDFCHGCGADMREGDSHEGSD